MRPYCVPSSNPSTLPTMLLHFCLSITPVNLDLSAQTAAPFELWLDLGIRYQAHGLQEESTITSEHPIDSTNSPSTSQKVGSFIYKQESRIYPMQWKDLSAFHSWCQEEELAHSIKLIAFSLVFRGHLWLQNHIYICMCQLSSGSSKYKKKFSCF